MRASLQPDEKSSGTTRKERGVLVVELPARCIPRNFNAVSLS